MYEFVVDVLESHYLILISVPVCCILLYLYRGWQEPSLPKLSCADTELNSHIIKSVTRLTSEYCPPLFLRNRHIQTFLAGMKTFTNVHFRREYIHLNDSGVVALDWVKTDCHLRDVSPILIVLSGITGDKGNVKSLCKLAAEKQYRVVVFNKRGHDGSFLSTPVLQKFGDSRDLRHCLEYVHRKYPESKMAAVGYSGGCGLLSRYLGQYTGETFLTATVFISSGFNLAHLCLSDISTFYEQIIVSSVLTKVIKPHRHILKSVVDFDDIDRCSTLRELEYHIYCKMHGYRDVAQFWTDNNPMKYVHDIDIPVMCINSLDDPVCLASNIPYDLFERPGWLLVTTEKGGHVGFLDNWKLESWADKCALDYIGSVLEFHKVAQ